MPADCIWKSIALISLLSKLCHVLSGANITGKMFLCYLRPSYNIFLVRSASDFVRLLSSWCITRLVGKPRCSPHGRRRSSLRARLQRVDDGSNPGDKEKRAHTLGKSEDTVSQLEDHILVTIKTLPPIRNVSVQARTCCQEEQERLNARAMEQFNSTECMNKKLTQSLLRSA